MAESIGTHPDRVYKAQVDAIADKQDGDIYVYPSLVELGESDVWHPVIHGEGENTLDLGGQFAPNTVAIKELAGRTNHNQNRISKLEKLGGGFKNILTNADFSVNQTGATKHTGIQPLTYVCDKWVVNIGDYQHTEPTCDAVVSNGILKMYNNSHPSTYEMRARQPLRFVNGKSVFELKETYTVSVLARADVGVDIKVNMFHTQHLSWDGDTSMMDGVMGIGTGEFKKYEFTFVNNTAPNTNEIATIVAFLAKGSTFEIKEPQIEKNDKATDFEYVPTELTRVICMAEYESGVASFVSVAGSLQSLTAVFKVTKNVNPVVTIKALNGTSNAVSTIGDGAGHIGTVSALAQRKEGVFRASITGLTEGKAYMFNWVADGRFY